MHLNTKMECNFIVGSYNMIGMFLLALEIMIKNKYKVMNIILVEVKGVVSSNFLSIT